MRKIVSFYKVNTDFEYVGHDPGGDIVEYGEFNDGDVLALISSIDYVDSCYKYYNTFLNVTQGRTIDHVDNEFLNTTYMDEFVPLGLERISLSDKSDIIRELICDYFMEKKDE